jgi:acylphosphatase
MIKAVHLLISGRVQGVYYRASACREATDLGLIGWVRNLPDGRVEAVAQGLASAVDALISWCHEGPSMARVTAVEVDEIAPDGQWPDFNVRSTHTRDA